MTEKTESMSPREIRKHNREIRRQMRIFKRALKEGKTPLEAARFLVDAYVQKPVPQPSTQPATLDIKERRRRKSRQVAMSLINRVESEKKALEIQVANLKASGGCSGCRKNALRNLEKRLDFFSQIESQIRR